MYSVRLTLDSEKFKADPVTKESFVAQFVLFVYMGRFLLPKCSTIYLRSSFSNTIKVQAITDEVL